MKYMTFNNACFFTAIATLLEDKNIDIKDSDIIKNTLIPYIFRYNEKEKAYESGYLIQDLNIINDYLQTFKVVLKEKVCKSKEQFINEISATKQCLIIPLKENDDTLHSYVFKGYQKGVFMLISMIRENEPENIKLYNTKELSKLLPNAPRYAYLKDGGQLGLINQKTRILRSIQVLNQYQQEVTEFCTKKQTYHNRINQKDKLFRPLLLNYLDIAWIIEEKTIYQKLKDIQKSYIDSFKQKSEVMLSDYLDMELIGEVIEKIKNLLIHFKVSLFKIGML